MIAATAQQKLPPGSIAAMIDVLPATAKPSVSFRDGAVAILRLSKARGQIECDALGTLFEQDHLDDDRRVMILDLLGTAGTPEAQIVMRRLLSLAVARRSSRMFARFVQRLAFVERPDGATLRFLVSIYVEGRQECHEVRAACAYALGAAIGRAHVWSLADAADQAAEVLRRDLETVTSAADKTLLLTALGNAGLEADVPFFVRFFTDSDSGVRAAAANALRRIHTPQARAHLLAMVDCGDATLAQAALSALFGQSLARKEVVRLAELVLAGRTALALDSRILRLIVTQKLSTLSEPVDIVEEAVHLLLSRIDMCSMPPQSGSYERLSIPPFPMPASDIEETEEEEDDGAPDTVRDPDPVAPESDIQVRNIKSAFHVAVPFKPLVKLT